MVNLYRSDEPIRLFVGLSLVVLVIAVRSLQYRFWWDWYCCFQQPHSIVLHAVICFHGGVDR